jgi:hypothetical protein
MPEFHFFVPSQWINIQLLEILMKRKIRKRFNLLTKSRSQRSLSLRKIKISHFSHFHWLKVLKPRHSEGYERERNKPRFLCFNVPILTKFWPPPRRTCPSVICRDCSFSSVNIILNDTHFRKGD